MLRQQAIKSRNCALKLSNDKILSDKIFNGKRAKAKREGLLKDSSLN